MNPDRGRAESSPRLLHREPRLGRDQRIPDSDATRSASLVYVVDDYDSVRDSLKWLARGESLSGDHLRSAPKTSGEILLHEDRMPESSTSAWPVNERTGLQEHLVARGRQSADPVSSPHGDVPMAVLQR